MNSLNVKHKTPTLTTRRIVNNNHTRNFINGKAKSLRRARGRR